MVPEEVIKDWVKKRLAFIMLFVLCGCGSCDQLPLHDQCGIHMADWVPPEPEAMIVISDDELIDMVSEDPPLETIESNIGTENVGLVDVRWEDSIAIQQAGP